MKFKAQFKDFWDILLCTVFVNCDFGCGGPDIEVGKAVGLV